MKHTRGEFYLFVLAIAIVEAISVYFFMEGFFLSRYALLDKSECSVIPMNNTKFGYEIMDRGRPSEIGSSGCWQEPTFSKVVVVLVDALRYDFTVYDKEAELAGNVPKYKNKMKMLNSLLENHPEHATLFKFLSDPPTTTAQRIKGLTTGSLPTFFDIVESFGSSKIVEDSWVTQMEGNIDWSVFVGDDTWVDLYSEKDFSEMHPFPCFNVKDLYTVDEGCIEVLSSKLIGAQDWNVIVAHFLGVDHCAHTFGVDVDCMEERLTTIDGVLHDIAKSIPEDALMVVFGDHGITPDGAHGGATTDEIESALFLFSSGKPIRNDEMISLLYPEMDESATGRRTIPQVDLVPSLSLALGMPIPYSNLGFIIPEFIADRDISTLVNAAWLNSRQIYNYIENYSSRYSQIDDLRLQLIVDRLEECSRLVETFIKEPSRTNGVVAFKSMLKFNRFVTSICREMWIDFDILLMVVGVVGSFAILIICILYAILLIGNRLWAVDSALRLAIYLIYLFAGFYLASVFSPDGPSLLPLYGMIVTLLSLSGYILRRKYAMLKIDIRFDSVLLLGMIFAKNGIIISDSFVMANGDCVHYFTLTACLILSMSRIKLRKNRLLILLLLIGICIRTSSYIMSLENGIDSSSPSKIYFYLKYIGILTLTLFTVKFGAEDAVKHGRYFKINFYSTMLVRVACVLVYISICDFNLMYLMEYEYLRIYIPKLLYMLALKSILHRFVCSLNAPKAQLPRIPAIIYVEVFFFLYNVLVGGRYAIQFLLMLVQSLLLFLFLKEGNYDISNSLDLFPIAIVVNLFSEQFFYLLGHYMQFSSIHFAVGFVGFEEFNPIFNGILILLETYAGHVTTFFLHSLVVLSTIWKVKGRNARSKAVMSILFINMGMEAARLFISMSAVFILRRHLMIHEVFSPMILFHIIAATISTLGYLIWCFLLLVGT